jgi:cytochrome c peroxidase
MTPSPSEIARRRVRIAVIAAVLPLLAAGAWFIAGRRSEPPSPPPSAADAADAADTIAWTPLERRRIATLSPLGPPPPDPTNRLAEDDAAAAFGQRIFFDEGFSRGPALSCASCHDPERWFTDGLPVPEGTLPGVRNTQSVVNAAHQRWFFRDGRADSLWSQAVEPFEDPKEMDSTRVRVVRRLAEDPGLRAGFEAAVGPLPPAAWFADMPEDATPLRPAGHPHREAWDAMDTDRRRTVDTIFTGLGKAIAAYERRLVSGPSPFDRFAADLAAGGDGGGHLSPDAARGLRLFLDRADCRTCHLGPRFSDGAFHATGVPRRPGDLRGDAGRFDGLPLAQGDPFNAAGAFSDDPDGPLAVIVQASVRQPEDHAAFRTPGLRNVAMTGPYMHAGQFETLEEVVRFYSTLEGAERFDHHGQSVLRRLDLGEREISDLVAFLESLTGTPPPGRLRTPPPPIASDSPPAP